MINGDDDDDDDNPLTHDSSNDDDEVWRPMLLLPTTALQEERDPVPEPTLFQCGNNNIVGSTAADSIPIPIRRLAWAVVALLLGSHTCLLHQCVTPSSQPGTIRRGRYRVVAPNNITILGKPTRDHERNNNSSSSSMHRDTLQPGDLVETLEGYDESFDTTFLVRYDHEDFIRVIFPTAGFLSKSRMATHLHLIHYYEEEEEEAGWLCPHPFIYQGWWPQDDYAGWWPLKGHRKRQYLYAPTALIVAQCLWNAMQVLQLFLLLALGYDCCSNDSTTNAVNVSYPFHTIRKILIAFLILCSVSLLPFSVYVISLGGHIFAALTILTTLVALFTLVPVLLISVGEGNKNTRTSQENDSHDNDDDDDDDNDDDDNDDDEANSRPWMVIREETLACLGNLCCHMYNYRVPWGSIYDCVDHVFGFKTGGDVTPKETFYLSQSNARIPLFVSQSDYTSTGAHVFLFIWSILPFLYVSYFGAMYLVAILSPGVKFQRAICLFGIINFLFFTDVVAYRYGRGYRSPHEDIFHWWEHFAWRAAILLPLYQNCTNGHWEHPKYPVAGKIFRLAATGYGIFFLVFQVVQGDLFQFATFMMWAEEWSFFELMGWEDHPVIYWLHLNAPKRQATLIMTVLYGYLHISGFALFRVNVRRERRFYECLQTRDEGDTLDDFHLETKSFAASDDGERTEHDASKPTA